MDRLFLCCQTTSMVQKNNECPLVERTATLEKFEGKGGWTFIRIPELPPDPEAIFGAVRVRGFIDHYPIAYALLQSMGNGTLFLPVNAAIRKAIKSKAGDKVRIVLYRAFATMEIPEELNLCLQDEPQAYKGFMLFDDREKRRIIEWIYGAKKEEIKIDRIAQLLNDLMTKNHM